MSYIPVHLMWENDPIEHSIPSYGMGSFLHQAYSTDHFGTIAR